MNELRQLLDDTSAVEPPDRLDLVTIRRVAARRRRTRSVRIGAGAVAASVAALAAVVAVVGPQPEAQPASNLPPGRVTSLADARPAVEGTDYRVVASRVRGDDGPEERISGVTDDGLGVVVDRTDTSGDPARVGLVDPGSGATEWLTGDRQVLYAAVALGEDRLVFQGSHWSDRELTVRVFDRGTGTWSTLRWPGLPRMLVMGTPVEHDGRLYLRLHPTGSETTYELWSVSLDDPGDVRDEQLDVGLVDITGDELTWSSSWNERTARIHVRDLRTGEEHSFDPEMGAACQLLELERVQESLLLGEYCGQHDGVDDNRLQVVTTEGEPVVTVRDEDVGHHIGDGGRVAVISGGRGGPFVLDPATGALRKVGADTSLWVGDMPVPSDTGLTRWATADTEWLVDWI